MIGPAIDQATQRRQGITGSAGKGRVSRWRTSHTMAAMAVKNTAALIQCFTVSMNTGAISTTVRKLSQSRAENAFMVSKPDKGLVLPNAMQGLAVRRQLRLTPLPQRLLEAMPVQLALDPALVQQLTVLDLHQHAP